MSLPLGLLAPSVAQASASPCVAVVSVPGTYLKVGFTDAPVRVGLPNEKPSND